MSRPQHLKDIYFFLRLKAWTNNHESFLLVSVIVLIKKYKLYLLELLQRKVITERTLKWPNCPVRNAILLNSCRTSTQLSKMGKKWNTAIIWNVVIQVLSQIWMNIFVFEMVVKTCRKCPVHNIFKITLFFSWIECIDQ